MTLVKLQMTGGACCFQLKGRHSDINIEKSSVYQNAPILYFLNCWLQNLLSACLSECVPYFDITKDRKNKHLNNNEKTKLCTMRCLSPAQHADEELKLNVKDQLHLTHSWLNWFGLWCEHACGLVITWRSNRSLSRHGSWYTSHCGGLHHLRRSIDMHSRLIRNQN